jgi:hypothetical protein
VAAATLAAEASAVPIVTGVAAGTGREERHAGVGWRPVAGVAVEPLVSTAQRKARVSIVVEAPALPAIRVVAAGAVRSEATDVEIVPGVAAVALERHVVEATRRVALLAGHRCVDAEQGKARDVVLEGYVVAPTPFDVTGIAGLSELAAMHVVVSVAGSTTGRELLSPQRPRVTSVARDLSVGPPQREILHLVVIESFGLPGNLAVTAPTAVAPPPAVDVVGPVAADAARRELSRVESLLVTGLAGQG